MSTRLAAVTAAAALALVHGPFRAAPDVSAPRLRPAEIPLAFEANVGQAHEDVRFVARAPRSAVFLTDDAAVLSLAPPDAPPRHVAMRFVGASPDARPRGGAPSASRVNVYLGDDPARWRSGVPTTSSVRYADAYPGVDVVFHGARGALEYDFVVAPGADPDRVAVAFDGADAVRLEGGALALRLGAGEVRHEAPVAYQTVAGERVDVACAWEPRGDGAFGLRLGAYDRDVPLVVDPTIVYATYLGGLGADEAEGIAVDDEGRAVVVGTTTSLDFPARDAAQSARPGTQAAFVTKLTSDGRDVVYSTYLGGTANAFGDAVTSGRAVDVDDAGAAYVTGWTESTDFPTTEGAFQESAPGVRRDAQDQPSDVNADAFVVKLADDGTLVWATYLGGTGDFPADQNDDDYGTGIAVDVTGAVHVTGQTLSTAFPTTADAFQAVDPDAQRFGGAILTNRHDVFFTRLAANGVAPTYSTYLGGNADDGGPGGRLFGGTGGVDLDSFGNAYLAGRTESTDFPTTTNAFQTVRGGGYDAFVVRMSRLTGEAGVTFSVGYSTYLGGVADEGGTAQSKFAVVGLRPGRAFVAGDTRSFDFPTTAGAFQRTFGGDPNTDAFVAKLNTTAVTRAASLEASTFLGGAADDLATGLDVDPSNRIHVAGRTASLDFPVAAPLQEFLRGPEDAFVAMLSPNAGALSFSTYLGGRGSDGAEGLAFRVPDDVHVAGTTTSDDFPASTVRFRGDFAGGATDAFVVKLSEEPEPNAHDLAVLGIEAPRHVRLTDRNGARRLPVVVRIQNRSTHAETITDAAMLAQVVQLTVESLGPCPAPVATLRDGQIRRLPLTLQPGQRTRIAFDVLFDCANDGVRSTRSDPAHDDFTYRAQVFHEPIDGAPDDHAVDDVCPRDPMNERDPFPDGTFRVRGCPRVFTDVDDRRTP
jgi:hypothetical protein